MKNFFSKIKHKVIKNSHVRKAIKRPLSLRGFIELEPDEFTFIDDVSIPRVSSNGVVYSSQIPTDLQCLPIAVYKLICENWTRIEHALGGEAVLRSCNTYRNIHIPEVDSTKEVYSNAWHRDTIGIPNVQLFILLHTTDRKHGPLRYVKAEDMKLVDMSYPWLKNPDHRAVDFSIDDNYVSYFEGIRGDWLLINTHTNYHSATIAALNQKRDMVSLAFEPKRLTSWANYLTGKDLELYVA